MILDNVNICNKIYERNRLGHSYLTIINAVERFNNFFAEKNEHPNSFKVKFQSLNQNDRTDLARGIFGLYFSSLFNLFLDSI
jgi:hypothetical protein